MGWCKGEARGGPSGRAASFALLAVEVGPEFIRMAQNLFRIAENCLGRRELANHRRRTAEIISSPDISVRRAKARSFSGCESNLAAFAPASSNWSSRGGNEAAEAFGVEGHFVARRIGRP